MIKNERQYRVTKAQARKFEEALARLSAAPPDERVHSRIRQAQLDGVRSQLDQLRAELAEYEALSSGVAPHLEWRDVSAFGSLLIKARIAAGLTQRQLAERLDLKEQQIQRYEATGYTTASLSRLAAVCEALGLDVRGAMAVPASQVSFATLLQRLRVAGLDPRFVRTRLLPAGVEKVPPSERNGPSGMATLRLAATLQRIYGWEPAAMLRERAPTVDPRPLAAARFKLPARVNEPRLAAYTVYAHYLALVVLHATPKPATLPPTDPRVIRRQVVSTYGSLTLGHTLQYVWALGIPVLPLADRGTFHAALWRAGGRNVIVLKQATRSQARWLFDLLHELYHAGEEPEEPDRSVLEMEGVHPVRGIAFSEVEQRASQFAGDVLLDGRADEVARLCVEEAQGSVERLKGVVAGVAAREGVALDALANYLAYRLSLQGINWWGTATNLQPAASDPWAIARDVLLAEIDASTLADEDRELLQRALVEA
jgi:transcriptional regulator with XRE-family HTH domain/Zn-dependent peptidase ImmA (M78 family)